MTLCSRDHVESRRTRMARCGRFVVAAVHSVALLGLLQLGCFSGRRNYCQDQPPNPLGSLEEHLLRYLPDPERVKGVLIKPRDDSAEDSVARLAPLIAFWFDPDALARMDETDSNSHPDVGLLSRLWPPPRIMYYDRTSVVIAGRSYDQILFAWPTGQPEARVLHGIRGTLDTNGFPLVWEVLDNRDVEVIFASEALERAAKARFESRYPEREFFAERSKTDAPRALIPRSFADGPIPLGPYVYLLGWIHDLHCRCSPSRVHEFVESEYYDLRPIQEFLRPIDECSWPGYERKPLETRIRWPY